MPVECYIRVEIRLENWDKTAKGENVLLETLKTAYLDSNGNIVGIVGISRDITHKHLSERDHLFFFFHGGNILKRLAGKDMLKKQKCQWYNFTLEA